MGQSGFGTEQSRVEWNRTGQALGLTLEDHSLPSISAYIHSSNMSSIE